MPSASAAAPMTRAEINALVLLALSQVALFLVPLVVLGQAIGWPASLRMPADEVLPLIARHATAVQVGYWGYLATATAMVPFVLALRRYTLSLGVGGLLVDTMAAFGVAAAVLKTLGIVRWLIAMPALAALHAETGDPAVRAAVAASYVALNGYAGGVGELLGVQLMSGLWLVLLGIALSRGGLRLNGLASLVIGAGFAFTALRTLVPALGSLGAVLPPAGLAWLLVLAVTLWRRG